MEVVIAGAGGAAHLPGMISALTSVPVIGVPIETKTLKGLDSLLSIVQMPAGIPVPTVAIGKPGAINAALAAISILGNKYPEIEKKLENFRIKQTKSIKNNLLMSNKTLGIIGGGQLGMFICIAARKVGLKTLVYSQEKDFSARKFCDKHIIGNIKAKKK